MPSVEVVLIVFGEEPDLTREGGSIPVTLTLEELTGKNVMLLPIGACDDGAHSQNEKINRSNYIKGVSSSPSTFRIYVHVRMVNRRLIRKEELHGFEESSLRQARSENNKKRLS